VDHRGYSECLAAAVRADELDALADPGQGRGVLEIG
jgi:hypothetical protein